MNCNQICEMLPDLAAGMNVAGAEVNEHLKSCAGCAGKLEEFRQTMAVLDEWEAPAPSQYFDVRLQARLREEMAKQPSGWMQWVRRPALAISVAVLMVVSVTLFREPAGTEGPKVPNTIAAAAEPGSAVADLQALDSNHELYSDFEVLDDLQVQQDVTANP